MPEQVERGKVIGRAVRSLSLRGLDLADTLRGRRDRLTPPRRLQFVGDSDFRSTGEEFAALFRQLADLRETDRVLDVGCGIGRMARVLVPVLRAPGSYDGFDIVGDAIAWCREHYRDTPAPFRFQHADLYNSEYNPRGIGSADDYRFPYRDDAFDLAIATSVFTHLLPDAADRYLAEAARVLAPGGRLFATWFLLGTEARRRDASRFGSREADAPAAVANPEAPEAAVAYEESWLRDRLRGHGLRLRKPIQYGSWGGGAGLTLQDVVVAELDRDGVGRG
jgi:SAM-dependent methyltransferase